MHCGILSWPTKSFFKSFYLESLTYGAFDVSVSQKLIQTHIYNQNVVQCAHRNNGIISSTLQMHIQGILWIWYTGIVLYEFTIFIIRRMTCLDYMRISNVFDTYP